MTTFLKKISITLLCLLPCITFAAKPFEFYQNELNPVIYDYAPQGYFYGLSIGLNRLNRWTSFHAVDLRPIGGSEIREFGSGVQSTFAFNGIKYQPYEIGYLASILFGKRCRYWRYESEFTWRQNRIRKIKNIPTFQVIPTANPDNWNSMPNGSFELRDEGKVTNISWMFNIIYDYYFRQDRIFPFIGVGAGINATFLTVDFTKTENSNPGSGIIGPQLDETLVDFAYQFICGIGYMINANTDITLTYKLFVATPDKFTVDKNNLNIKTDAAELAVQRTVDTDYKIRNMNHSVMLEFRIFN